jgi:hypothetical protein
MAVATGVGAIVSHAGFQGHQSLATDFRLITIDDWNKYSGEAVEIRKMIFGYRKKILQADQEDP